MTDASAARLLASLGRTPQLVRAAVARIPDTEPTGDLSAAWSPVQVVLHLAAVDAEVWRPRLQQLATGRHPHWTWTEPDMTGRAVTSMDAGLDAFETGRAALIAETAGLDAAGWRQTGTHAVFGELDAGGLLREALAHDLEHLADLEDRNGP